MRQNRWRGVWLFAVLSLSFLSSKYALGANPGGLETEMAISHVSQTAIFPSADWPLPLPTEKQVAEVQICNLDKAPYERYSFWLDVNAVPRSYPLLTACDWAILATTFAHEIPDDEGIPRGASQTFYHTIAQNPAFAFVPIFMSIYAGRERNTFVKAPPFTKSPIVSIEVRYKLSRLGLITTDYTYTITQADGDNPTVAFLEPDGENRLIQAGPFIHQYVQEIGSTLTDLIPVNAPISLKTCPAISSQGWTPTLYSWQAILLFKDGTQVEMLSNDGLSSQIKVASQRYFQYYSSSWDSLWTIGESLGLPDYDPPSICDSFQDALQRAYPQFKTIWHKE